MNLPDPEGPVGLEPAHGIHTHPLPHRHILPTHPHAHVHSLHCERGRGRRTRNVHTYNAVLYVTLQCDFNLLGVNYSSAWFRRHVASCDYHFKETTAVVSVLYGSEAPYPETRTSTSINGTRFAVLNTLFVYTTPPEIRTPICTCTCITFNSVFFQSINMAAKQ